MQQTREELDALRAAIDEAEASAALWAGSLVELVVALVVAGAGLLSLFAR